MIGKTLSKILFFFNQSEKKKLAVILLCIILMGFVEMIGIAAILPFLALVTKPEIVHSSRVISMVYNTLGFHEPTMFMLFVGALVFLTLVLGNAFSAIVSWVTMRFCYYQGTKISTNLFSKYLSQPYAFFLNRNSSDLAKKVVVDTDRMVVGIFINSMQSFSKCIILLCITALLFFVEPLLASAILIVLGSAYALSYAFIRKRLANAGKLASEVSTTRYQVIDEATGAIKELKVLGTEKTFVDSFNHCATRYAKAETLSQLSPLITRYVVEAIAFGGMILIALYLIASQEDIAKFMPLLGLYGLAGYRMMPAMQQLFVGFTSVRYHFTALETLYQEMQLPDGTAMHQPQEVLKLEQSVSLNALSYHYPGAPREALNQIHITFNKHATIGIVGSSGAGKTTLIDIILGLLEPTQGKLCIDNVEVNRHNLGAWQRNIGYVPQNIFILDTTIAGNIALGVPPHQIDHKALKRAAALANLDEFITKELAQGYQTMVGERGVRLSGGQRQRIGIARALYHDPQFLIFDEATSALDSMTEKVIMEAIQSLAHRKTIVLVAHRLNTVKNCDLIYVLKEGQVAGFGSYQQLLDSNHIFQHLANAHAGA